MYLVLYAVLFLDTSYQRHLVSILDQQLVFFLIFVCSGIRIPLDVGDKLTSTSVKILKFHV